MLRRVEPRLRARAARGQRRLPRADRRIVWLVAAGLLLTALLLAALLRRAADIDPRAAFGSADERRAAGVLPSSRPGR